MPPASLDSRPRIAAALAAFGTSPLHPAALGFFNALGYDSERRLRIEPATPQNFLATLAQSRTPNPEAALLADWQSAEFLFQITTDEVRTLAQGGFNFGDRGKFDATAYDSYLFIAVQLSGPRYTRTQLAGVVREINRLFPQPVLVLLRHGDTVSLGIIHRRPGRRDPSRDVLEKITLIKDISCATPLRAHVDILSEFSLDELQADHPFHDFAGLHAAWEKRLASYQLTESFYRDVAHWYFWALKPDTKVVYPRDIQSLDPKSEKGKELRSMFLIRLLTRLIFCWFLKEKDLIPSQLFRRHDAARLINGIEDTDDNYYRLVLQNLFFATLNVPHEDRRFIRNSFHGKNPDYTNQHVFRYSDECTDLPAFKRLLGEIPFLNGGLFECLDKKADKTKGIAEQRLDGFSETRSKQAQLPNDLFFGEDRLVDLTHVYRDGKGAPKKPIMENAAGLITILSRYKFTVLENTPLEEEIALDPELLGKVFENLLASYNEDTGTQARKATGSFYTPREIVSYMVDEALRAYLEAALGLKSLADASPANPPGSLGPTQEKLRDLFDLAKTGNPFDEKETVALIAAIDRIKILDPACGSGAFPMGALQRLVALLAKLDPNNRRWKEQQLAKVEHDRRLAMTMEDDDLREATLAEAADRAADIQRSFDTHFHELDFARKLYLIENCIYGVDIQPIATQIAKLRFFISLIVDQRVEATGDDARRNRGVRPLPNLETKLVAADFLIPIERRATQGALFEDDTEALRQLIELRKKLAQVRHDHFGARTPAKKERCRADDARLRSEMASLLSKTTPQAEQMAKWDPYDQNAHAGFFDSEWMFGLPIGRIRLDATSAVTMSGHFSFLNETTGQMELAGAGREVESGFDVILGNPPYIRLQMLKQKSPAIADFLKSHYVSASKGNYDLYVVFVEAGMRALKSEGNLAYILPHKFFNAEYGEPLRGLLSKGRHLHEIVHFGDQQVFPGATNYVCLLFLHNTPQARFHFIRADVLRNWLVSKQATEGWFEAKKATSADWNFTVGSGAEIFARLSESKPKLGDIADLFVGLQTDADDVFIVEAVREKGARVVCLSEHTGCEHEFERKHLKRFLKGSLDIRRFKLEGENKRLIFPYETVDGASHLITAADYMQRFPLTWDYLKLCKKRLSARAGGEFSDYWHGYVYKKNHTRFEQQKLLTPSIGTGACFAGDFDGDFFFVGSGGGGGGGYGIVPTESGRFGIKALLGILNSSIQTYYLRNVSTTFRGGYLALNRQYIEQLPIPAATPANQSTVETLVDYLLWLHRQPAVVAAENPRDPVMLAFWEQVINALVYELFFPAELAAARLAFFRLVDEAALPPVAALFTPDGKRPCVDDAERLASLRAHFERLSASNSPLAAALFTLGGLDLVRLIEGRP